MTNTMLPDAKTTDENNAAPNADEPRRMDLKRRRRFGDRSDGRRLRTLPPISRISPYIMKTRTGASNYISDSVEMSEIEKYIREKRAAGFSGFGVLHAVLAAHVRTVSQRPAINRFLSGQRVFARHNIQVNISIKKEMTLESPDTVLKAEFPHDATAEEVYAILNGLIEKEKSSSDLDSSFDKTARILNYIPGLFLKFAVWFLNLLDYFGLIPRKLLFISPFHGSFFVTSMGSLGIPPIYHHLYDFGNVPIFLAFGAKRTRHEVLPDGTPVTRKYLDYKLVCDERICDGFYYASALKYFKQLLKNPAVLSRRPEKVVEDID